MDHYGELDQIPSLALACASAPQMHAVFPPTCATEMMVQRLIRFALDCNFDDTHSIPNTSISTTCSLSLHSPCAGAESFKNFTCDDCCFTWAPRNLVV